MTTAVVINKGQKIPKNPIVIEGFPSKGFVSTISARYIIDELGMEPIGYIESDKLKSVAVIHKSIPMRPIRIYAKDNILVIFSELILPINQVPEFSCALIEWLAKIDPGMLVLLAGISGKNTDKNHEIFAIANDIKLQKKLSELGINRVEEGMLTGISSDLVLYAMESNIPWVSLMAETKSLPDPLAAASMLAILNKVLDLNVDTKRLEEEGKKIEEMVTEITTQMQRGKEGYREMEAYSPMYG